MDLRAFNASAVRNILHLFRYPNLCLPHATVSTFARLPIPLNGAFEKSKNVDIRAVVLDKDNCFAYPKSNTIYESYEHHFNSLKEVYPGRRLLIVSNTAGAASIDPTGALAKELERTTGVTVLPHSQKKPGCGSDIMSYFRQHPETGVVRPDQIAVVGDRLTTDVMMANKMGSYAVWVKDGIVPIQEASLFVRIEQRFAAVLLRRSYVAPDPSKYRSNGFTLH